MPGPQSPDVVDQPGPQQMPQQEDPLQRIQAIFGVPKEEILNKLVQHINNMPVREQPSMARRIMGAIAGLSASGPAHYENGAALGFRSNPKEQMAIQDAFTNQPYYQKMQDWEAKLKPLEEVSRLEGQRNTNQRLLTNEALGRDIQSRREADYRKDIESKSVDREERRKIAQQRANAYRLKSEGHVISEDEKGRVIAINPTTHKSSVITDDETDEPMMASKMPEELKMNLDFQNKQKLIQSRTAGAQAVEGVKEANRQKDIAARGVQTRQNIGARGAAAIETKKTIPGKAATVSQAGTNKPETEANKQKRMVNRAQQVLIDHPEFKDVLAIEGNRVILTDESEIYRANPSRKVRARQAKRLMSQGTEQPQQETAKPDRLGIRK